MSTQQCDGAFTGPEPKFWGWLVRKLPLKFAPDWLNNWLAWQYWKRMDR